MATAVITEKVIDEGDQDPCREEKCHTCRSFWMATSLYKCACCW